MSPITENTPQSRDFQNDLPLHPAARELLTYFFDAGWSDPTKIHQRSAELRNRIGAARESIAANLGISTSELEVVGELGFGFHTAVSGLLAPNHEFVIGEIDRQVIHALARLHSNAGGRVTVVKPDREGALNYQGSLLNESAVLSWQATNREVGMKQNPPMIKESQSLFADMTSTYPLRSLPENWDSALWDPRNFGGPQGIALIGISTRGHWHNPGPEIDNRRVYGSFSKPLLLATAVALENWIKTAEDDMSRISLLNTTLREELVNKIPQIHIASPRDADSRFLACVIPGVIAEEVLRAVEKRGFLIDAGSACAAGALAPSHVLTAMGLPAEGNFRMTLKADQTEESVRGLVEALVKGIAASA